MRGANRLQGVSSMLEYRIRTTMTGGISLKAPPQLSGFLPVGWSGGKARSLFLMSGGCVSAAQWLRLFRATVE